MVTHVIRKFGNRPEGFEPSAVQTGKPRQGSAPIRVLDGDHIKYSPGRGKSQVYLGGTYD